MAIDKAFLRRVTLFETLEESALDALSERLIERRFGRGQVVFTEEETGEYMYIVREGRVKVSRWLPDGREVILAFRGSADFFGEMALLDGYSPRATITAVLPSAILSLSRAAFRELLKQAPFADVLMRTLCLRCRDAWQQIEILSHRNAEARIRMALHHLCEQEGEEVDGRVRLAVRLTHRDLANIAGVSRETATRALRHLVHEKLVEVDGRIFEIPDPDRLLELPSD
jgi:CRP/FNR family transcriptional regulator